MPASVETSARVVAGRYELGELIGSGGMAEVYLARDNRLDRAVAVKLLGPAFAADPDLVERFRREAQAAAGINHPNVVAIYDWGQDGRAYYLVMEYVAGQNLRELVRQHGPLPEGRALAIAAEVAAALEAAHARGVVHRDVKPHNVMQDDRGRVKVADFGIAHAGGTTTLTRTGAGVLGSAHYMSPEQARGERVDARSDLYSLGALLFELLTGRTPYQGDAPLVVAMQHLNAPVPSAREVRPDLSAATTALLDRALAKDPAARYPSAAAMRVALEAARANPTAAGTAVAAAPAGWSTAPPRRSFLAERWPLLLALGLVMVLVLAVLRARGDGTPAAASSPVAAPSQTAAAQPTVSVAAQAGKPTTVPPTATAAPPTATRVPPTPTAAPPTATPAPPPAVVAPVQPEPAKIPPGQLRKKEKDKERD
jgi:eukaryotic-like serine/threonine-protein kinase